MRYRVPMMILAGVSLLISASPAVAEGQLPDFRYPAAPGPRITTPPQASTWAPLRLDESRQQFAIEPRGAGTLAFGGLVGGVLGFFGGALAGVALCRCDSGSDDYAPLAAAALGGAVGVTLGIPTGAHLTNGRNGKLGTSMAASGIIAIVGILAAAAINDETASSMLLVMIPIAQIASAVSIESKTTR